MTPSYLSDFEDGLTSEFSGASGSRSVHTGVGILIHDAVNRRLVEGASIHLELAPEMLEETARDPAQLARYEMIVAEEADAREIRAALSCT